MTTICLQQYPVTQGLTYLLSFIAQPQGIKFNLKQLKKGIMNRNNTKDSYVQPYLQAQRASSRRWSGRGGKEGKVPFTSVASAGR